MGFRRVGAVELALHLEDAAVVLPTEHVLRRWEEGDLRAVRRAGTVVQVLPGWWAARMHSESLAVRTRAAGLWAGPDAVVIGGAAAAAWRVVPMPGVAPAVRVAVRHGTQRPCPPWLRLRRINVLPPFAEWEGIRIARPDWAVATAFGDQPVERARDIAFLALQHGLVTPESLARVDEQAPRLEGRRELRAIVDAMERGAESHLEEHALLRVFTGEEFGDWVRQHRIVLDGRRFRLDMADLRTRTVVELDGENHEDPKQRLRDIRRDSVLAANGFLTIRFAGRDLLRQPAECRDLVLRAVALRRPRE